MSAKNLNIKSFHGGSIFADWFTLIVPLEFLELAENDVVQLRLKGNVLGNLKVCGLRNIKINDATDFLSATINGEGDVAKLKRQLATEFCAVQMGDLVQHVILKYEKRNLQNFATAVSCYYDDVKVEEALYQSHQLNEQ